MFLTAAPSPPRCIRRRRRFGGDARHAPRASKRKFYYIQKRKTPRKRCLSFWQGQKDLNLLRKPSCGAQNCFCLGATSNFDRCAITVSLYPPPAALRRRCPARSACLGGHKPFTTTKNKVSQKRYLVFGRGRRTWTCFASPLAVPKIAFALERQAILTAAPSPPRCIRHRRRFGGDARHAPRASKRKFYYIQKRKTPRKRCLSFWQGQKDLNPRHAVLELHTVLFMLIYIELYNHL